MKKLNNFQKRIKLAGIHLDKGVEHFKKAMIIPCETTDSIEISIIIDTIEKIKKSLEKKLI